MVIFHISIPSSRVKSQRQSPKKRSTRTKKRMRMNKMKAWTYLNRRAHQVSEALRTLTPNLSTDSLGLPYSSGLFRTQESLDCKHQHASRTSRQNLRIFREKAKIQSYLA